MVQQTGWTPFPFRLRHWEAYSGGRAASSMRRPAVADLLHGVPIILDGMQSNQNPLQTI